MPKNLIYGAKVFYSLTPWNGTFNSALPNPIEACFKSLPEVGFEAQEVESTDSCSPGGSIERIAGMADGKPFTLSCNWPGPEDPAWGFGANALPSRAQAKVTIGMEIRMTQFGANTRTRFDVVLLGFSFEGGGVNDILGMMINGRITGPLFFTNAA